MDMESWLASKRAAEIIQEKQQPITYLNINAAINKASREFEKREKKDDGLFIHDSFNR